MKKILFSILILSQLTSCINDESSSRPSSNASNSSTSSSSSTGSSSSDEGDGNETTTESISSDSESIETNSLRVLKISAVNMINGNVGVCDITNKAFLVNKEDSNQEIVLCENQLTRLYLVSHKGAVIIHTLDLVTNKLILQANYSTGNLIELDKEQDIHYGAANPYGFTYAKINEVLITDLEMVKKFKTLKEELVELKKDADSIEKSGQSINVELSEKIQVLEAELENLEEQILL